MTLILMPRAERFHCGEGSDLGGTCWQVKPMLGLVICQIVTFRHTLSLHLCVQELQPSRQAGRLPSCGDPYKEC